jgi:hypothetical protein
MRVATAVCLMLVTAVAGAGTEHAPPAGFVPNSETAVKIAEAMLLPIYGEKRVESAKPFSAHLKDGVWYVDEKLCEIGPPFEADVKIEVCKGDWLEVQLSERDAHAISITVGMTNPAPGERPKEGFVPDSATAVKIGEAVLAPVYGKKQIESERPFAAKLNDKVWNVYGSLNCPDGKGGITSECDGGVAGVELSKADGHVLNIGHGK